MRINLFALIMTIIRFLAHCFLTSKNAGGGGEGGGGGAQNNLINLKRLFSSY